MRLINTTQNNKFGSDLFIAQDKAYYLGDENTDGTWRILRSGAYLIFEKRESGNYVEKSRLEHSLLDTGLDTSGVISWTGTDILTINADDTKFDISEITIGFVDKSDPDPDNHTKEIKIFAAQTEVAATYLASNVGTWIGYNSAGTIVQSPTEFTPEQRNTIVQIGRLGHFGKTAITGVFDLVWLYETSHNWAIEQAAHGTQLLFGAEITANGTNRKIDRSIGNFVRIGAGVTRNAINFPQSPSAVQLSMIPAWNSETNEAILGDATTDVDWLHYDNSSGTLQDVGAGKYANLFILHFPYKSNITTFLIYGNKEYSSLEFAEQGAFNKEYNVPSDITGGSIIASISVLKETTELSTAIAGGTAIILPSPEAAGGGGSVITYWAKVGSDLSPATPSDNIKLATGNIQLGDAIFSHDNLTHDPVYLSGQSGLDDLSSSGAYALNENAIFQIRIDGIGSPNTFEWRKGLIGSWTSGVAMTGSAQLLQDGISITWAAITGHTNNDEWEMAVGHAIHFNEALHVLDDLTADGDLVVAGQLRSLSPVKISGGVALVNNAEISTIEAVLEFVDATTGTKTLAELAFGRNQTTGWLWGGEVTINVDDTKVDISAGAVQIVTGTDNPVAKIISWDAQTAIDPGLSSYTNWIGVKDDGFGEAEFVFQILFNPVERRTHALLGKIRDNAGTGPSITNIDDFERPAWGITTAFHDFVLAFGSFSVKGNDITANAGGNLLLDKSAGESFRYHTEDTIGRENHHIDAAQIPRNSYDYHIQGSSQLVNHSTIQPNLMDDGAQGTKAVSTNKFTRQEIRIWPVSGAFHMTYGQTEFGSLQAAIDAGPEPMADINTKMTNGAIHIASLVIQEGTTNILASLGSGAEIITLAGAGGGSGGGGISNVVEDTTPQSGGDWDVNGFKITSASNGDIEITPDGTGNVGFGTDTPDRMVHLKGSNANIRIERESSFGATLFLSNTDGVNTTHWKIEALQNGAGAGSGSIIISDDGISSGGSSTIRFEIDENGKLHIEGLEVAGYTKLGSDAPAIKVKKLTGTTAATEGADTSTAHGLDSTKILSISVHSEYTSGSSVPTGYTASAGYEIDARWDSADIVVSTHATNSENILSKPFTVLLTYEE